MSSVTLISNVNAKLRRLSIKHNPTAASSVLTEMAMMCVETGMLHALIQFADASSAQAAKMVCNANYFCPVRLQYQRTLKLTQLYLKAFYNIAVMCF